LRGNDLSAKTTDISEFCFRSSQPFFESCFRSKTLRSEIINQIIFMFAHRVRLNVFVLFIFLYYERILCQNLKQPNLGRTGAFSSEKWFFKNSLKCSETNNQYMISAEALRKYKIKSWRIFSSNSPPVKWRVYKQKCVSQPLKLFQRIYLSFILKSLFLKTIPSIYITKQNKKSEPKKSEYKKSV